MSVRVVRQSKFRHVFGKPERKENCYDNVRITKSNWEGSTYCAVNSKFVAIIVESAGGGAFLVLPLSKSGRVERDAPVVGGHKAEVLDIKWCPFHDDIIASGSEDCTVKIWQIPERGLVINLTDPIADLIYHQRRVGVVEWHPTVRNILLSAGADNKVCIWNVGTGEVLSEAELPNVIFSASFSYNGSKLVTACKDKIVRVHNARTLEVLQEGMAHDGVKACQAIFLKDDRIFTTGFSKMSERQYALWAAEGENSIGGTEALKLEEIDSSNGVVFIFYDPDTNIVYLTGKGDSVIRYFEIADEFPYVFYLSTFQSNQPQRGIGYMPKRGVNVNINEIARFYKLHAGAGRDGGLCEPIAMTVPRKSELFQDDLYPDTAGGEPALTADEWFHEGRDAAPIMVPMKDLFQAPDKKAQVKSSVLLGTKPSALDAKKPAATASGSLAGSTSSAHSSAAGGGKANGVLAAPTAHSTASDSGSAAGTQRAAAGGAALAAPAAAAAVPTAEQLAVASEVKGLREEVKALKATVSQQESRIKALETKLSEILDELLAESEKLVSDEFADAVEGIEFEDDGAV